MVKQTKQRSGWPAKKTLAALGIPRGSYYRWLQEEAWAREQKEAPRPVQAFEALEEERQALLKYAREHAAIRHRELAWKMIDDDAAYLSPSTVYRILREANLMCRQRGRQKRLREEEDCERTRVLIACLILLGSNDQAEMITCKSASIDAELGQPRPPPSSTFAAADTSPFSEVFGSISVRAKSAAGSNPVTPTRT